jgi:hypothetical protein
MRVLYCVKVAAGSNKDKFATLQWRRNSDGTNIMAIPSHGTFPRCKFMATVSSAEALRDYMQEKRPENTYEIVVFHEQPTQRIIPREEDNERNIEPDL